MIFWEVIQLFCQRGLGQMNKRVAAPIQRVAKQWFEQGGRFHSNHFWQPVSNIIPSLSATCAFFVTPCGAHIPVHATYMQLPSRSNLRSSVKDGQSANKFRKLQISKVSDLDNLLDCRKFRKCVTLLICEPNICRFVICAWICDLRT